MGNMQRTALFCLISLRYFPIPHHRPVILDDVTLTMEGSSVLDVQNIAKNTPRTVLSECVQTICRTIDKETARSA